MAPYSEPSIGAVPAMPEVAAATARIRQLLAGARPDLAVVLGSGLGPGLGSWTELGSLAYAECFPWVARGGGVPGHGGRWRVGRVGDATVVALDGRLHLYEGYSPARSLAPLDALLALEPRLLLLTNAAGCLRAEWAPGELMLISDHLNLTGAHPLRGADGVGAGGDAFLDMSDLYSAEWRARLRRWAAAEGLVLHEGVYAGVAGPTYETPAEVRALATLGADAVGMSTVLEAIAARARGCPVLGLSCLTNRAAGLAAEPLTHTEVLRRGRAAAGRIARLVAWLAGQSHRGGTR